MGLEGLVTVEKIRAAINASLSGLSNSDATITITKNDNTTSTITINNVANATTATTATKLESSTVGSGVKAIYLNAGTATESNSTVGDSTTPVYLNAGAMQVLVPVGLFQQDRQVGLGKIPLDLPSSGG